MIGFAAVGGMAPVANAAEPVVTVAAEDLSSTSAGAADADSSAAAVAGASPSQTLALSCWNARVDGGWFYETCNGKKYKPFVDCSNGYRYISKTYYGGQHNFALQCPARTTAVRGGAIGS
ncbi:hypothetical protein [Streptomyces sp. CBMA156]|uniref:hypothetical protein n=1 Tax=Streptomyces sp. CBMA156 TaxID=1930280 RepID=UPI001661BB12|nr:hypothetical protein [Streptomyces sp. CBMA156]